MRTWRFPSSRGGTDYTSTLQETGQLHCTCPGYFIIKKDKPQKCKHFDQIAKELGVKLEIRGQYAFIPILAPEQGKLQIQDEPAAPEDPKRADGTALGYVNPMLASAMKEDMLERFLLGDMSDFGPDWIQELKYDGLRVVTSVEECGKVHMWARPKEGTQGIKQPVPEHLRQALSTFPAGTYDGELIAGEYGKSYDVRRLDKAHMLRLAVFDLLICGEFQITNHKLSDRRRALEKIFDRNVSDRVFLVPAMPVSLADIEKIWQKGGEGVILKRLSSVYRPGGRPADWRKIKKTFPAILEIVGFAEGLNGPYSRVLLRDKRGVETRCKTKNNWWLGEFEKNWKKYIGQYLVIRHFGVTPSGKYRGPIIWDHMAGEGERP
jgi:ATP-dependent DNA ligase